MNQTIVDVVQAAIPAADERIVSYVLWGRTPYPFVQPSARSIYKAASSLQRAATKGVRLCDWCHRVARPRRYTCAACAAALDDAGAKDQG